jgi:hypothetical protein
MAEEQRIAVRESGGTRLFEHLGSTPVELEIVKVAAAPAVTHLKYRVVK